MLPNVPVGNVAQANVPGGYVPQPNAAGGYVPRPNAPGRDVALSEEALQEILSYNASFRRTCKPKPN